MGMLNLINLSEVLFSDILKLVEQRFSQFEVAEHSLILLLLSEGSASIGVEHRQNIVLDNLSCQLWSHLLHAQLLFEFVARFRWVFFDRRLGAHRLSSVGELVLLAVRGGRKQTGVLRCGLDPVVLCAGSLGGQWPHRLEVFAVQLVLVAVIRYRVRSL